MKKALSFVLAIIMMLACVPMMTFAQVENCEHEYVWTYTCDGKAEFDCTSQDDVIIKSRACKNCGDIAEVIGEIMTQETHRWIKISESGPICENPENKEELIPYVLYKCEFCTATHKVQQEYSGHQWGEWEVLVNCFEGENPLESGVYTRTCNLCEKQDTKKIDDHLFIVIEGRAPTCYKNGYEAYRRCLICNSETPKTVIEKYTHVDADGNNKCDLCDGLMAGDGTACRCLCHSDLDLVINYILPIVKFIWNLLGMDTCNCGAKH